MGCGWARPVHEQGQWEPMRTECSQQQLMKEDYGKEHPGLHPLHSNKRPNWQEEWHSEQ